MSRANYKSSRHVTFKEFMNGFKNIEPMTNFEIINKCKELQIKNFKGVFMRDELNKQTKVTNDESLILNIDHSSNNGTHWVALFTKDNACYYFDSYGFPPPKEILKYCNTFRKRMCNSYPIQKINQVICGHYCIYVLYRLSNARCLTTGKFYDLCAELYKCNNEF